MDNARFLLRRYDGAVRLEEVGVPVTSDAEMVASGWRVKVSTRKDGNLWRFQATVLQRGEGGIAIGIGRLTKGERPHLAIPAAVYDGNRFRALPLKYPCILRESEDLRPDLPTTISWVPRLPCLQILAGDAALPAVGTGGAWWITRQRTEWGETGIEAREDESGLWTAFLFPGVREGKIYNGSPEWRDTPDLAATPNVGDALSFEVLECSSVGSSPRDLYRTLLEHRKGLWPVGGRHELPFSEAGRLIEAKHNRYYWNEKEGYYMLSDGSEPYGQWQAGWVGGGIQTFGLSVSENPITKERVRVMLDFITGKAQTENGLYWSFCIDGRMDTDMVDMDYGRDWHLIRRSGDVLYFLLKAFDVLERQAATIKSSWLESAELAADALTDIWWKNGRFGMFVSQFTGEIRSGDTASGAIIPAALVQAHRRFPGKGYLAIAEQSARYYVENYLDNGFTNGGPGEALQCPDSESAFGLLESLVELHELTHDSVWLDHAEAAAHLAASWVMPYDFEFPPDSTFGKLDMRTTGSVWANIQNKHSAPGICTLSGVSLLKLYRSTGNAAYLELLRDIAHGVTQYLSRVDRPVFGLLPGGSCERVNTSDWEAPNCGPGEGFKVDCWSSISALLTWAEVPGVYVRLDNGFVQALDHVDVVSFDGQTLVLRNPTRFDASVRVLAETAADIGRPLGSAFVHELPAIVVRAGSEASLSWA